MSELLWQKRIRNWAGFLDGILPFLSLFGAFLFDYVTGALSKGFWNDFSISATYYVSPALAGILTATSLVRMYYDGYDLQDNLVTTLSGHICTLYTLTDVLNLHRFWHYILHKFINIFRRYFVNFLHRGKEWYFWNCYREGLVFR